MNLTEHGKPQLYGYYYVEFNNGKQGIKQFGEFANTWKPKKTFCEVPSYEEWQRILHYASKYEHEYTSCVMDYEDLKQENTKLKELLKECREHLITYKRDDLDKGYVVYDGSYLIDKNNQVLGEK